MTDTPPISIPAGMTDAQLRATYTREAPHRPHWPQPFEAAMRHPLIGRTLVLLTRTAVPAFARRAPPRKPHTQPEFVQVAPASVLKRRGAPVNYGLDFKSLAAGEKEEQ